MRLVILFLVTATLTFAHRDRIDTPSLYRLEFGAGRYVLAEAERGQISALSIHEPTGEVLIVPKAELQKVANLQLGTLKVLWSDSPPRTKVPYKYIRISYGVPAEAKFGEFPFAEFMFLDGTYEKLTITYKIDANTWQMEKK